MSALRDTGYAKLNLALHVRERMADGYHRIETLFAFCDDGDELSAAELDEIRVDVTGPFAEQLHACGGNLIRDAALALQEKAGEEARGRGARIALLKILPIASGLGGGSADAAATLRLLNRLWDLNWPAERLEDVARAIGADVPACVHSLPMRGIGRGDELEPVELGLSGAPVLVVNPRVELSTPEVFERWDGIDRGPLKGWRHGRNDLEQPATTLVPLIGAVTAWLSAQQGAQCVRMSGSGATCFALFETEEQRDRASDAVPREWWRLASRLR